MPSLVLNAKGSIEVRSAKYYQSFSFPQRGFSGVWPEACQYTKARYRQRRLEFSEETADGVAGELSLREEKKCP